MVKKKDDTITKLNRRHLHESLSNELYGLDELDARPKVRANDLSKNISKLRFTDSDKKFYN